MNKGWLKGRIPQSNGLYPVLRWGYQPVKFLRHRTAELMAMPKARRLIANYLAQPGFKGLHAGCGPFHLAGWINSELNRFRDKADIAQDVTRRFPFPDECLDAIYSSEVIEHLPRPGAMSFMRESYRVLKSGGVLRLTTPDVAECCRLFLGLRDDVSLEQFRGVWRDGPFSPERWINTQFRAYGHEYLYSFDGLAERLRHAGFREVIRCAPQETKSSHPQLSGLETRYGPNSPEWLWARTLIVEATK